MTTATGPDLSGAKAAVEALMDDECSITTNPDSDDDLNPVTLRFDRGADQPVYSGRCKVKALGSVAQRWSNGGRDVTATAYEVGLPLDDAPELRKGMRLKLTGSRRDPDLVGQVFVIQSPVYSTMAVQRKATMTLESETPAEEAEPPAEGA